MYVLRAFTLPDGTYTADPKMLALVGMLLDIVTGIGANLSVLCFGRWLLVKFGVLKVNERYRTQFGRFFLTMLGVVVVLVVSIPIVVSGGFPLRKDSTPSISGVDALSFEENARFREILTGVMQSDEALTTVVHKEFWELMKKMGIIEKNQIKQFKDLITGVSGKYQRYIWEDAQQSLQQGRPFKSLQREEYEKHLKSIGAITDLRIKQNEEFNSKIAKKQPIDFQGKKMIVTEEFTEEVLGNLDSVTKRAELLFTPIVSK